jgi:H+-transporting ATPase
LQEHKAKFDDLEAAHTKLKWVPFNPTDKFTSITLQDNKSGKVFRVLKGSPQVVLKKAHK